MTNPYSPSDGNAAALPTGGPAENCLDTEPRFRWQVVPTLATYLFAIVFIALTLFATLGIHQTATSTSNYPYRIAAILEMGFAAVWLALGLVVQLIAARKWMKRRYVSAMLLNVLGAIVFYAIITVNAAAYIPWEWFTEYWGWDGWDR